MMFELVEAVCIYIFSVEYLARLFTAWAARFGEKFEIVLDVVTMPKPANPALARTWAFVTNPMNMIDFFAILPFYLNMMMDGGGGGFGFLRVLRLARVFRVFKMGKYSAGMSLLTNVLSKSAPALRLLCFFSLIGMILFGSMIFFCEQGMWMVTEAYPNGAYLRWDVTGTKLEVSPFVSIPGCFWWVIVTQTTVGYGDQYPVTDMGKVVGSICMVSGILVLALPITIIGANFANEYAKVQADEARERMELAAELAEDAARAAAEEAEAAIEAKKKKKAPLRRNNSFFGSMMGGTKPKHVSVAPAEAAEEGEGNTTPVTPFGDNMPGRRTMFNEQASSEGGLDDEESDEEDLEAIRMNRVRSEMNRKSSDLNRMIRDYIDAAHISQRASAHLLEEVTDILDLLDTEDVQFISAEKTMAMIAICWHWLKKCDDDPAVVTNERQRELLLKSILDFGSSTVAPDTLP